jgi:hypothetical protein
MWERVRQAHYPSKPSRFSSIFLCSTESDLEEFRNSNGRKLDIPYEVELVDPDLEQHAGDWTLANMTDTDNISVFEQRAHHFWQGNNIVKQEILSLSPIRILRQL